MVNKLKIFTFNVNGIRARYHQLEFLISKHKPDVVGLQEIKVSDDQFPIRMINDMGYEVAFHGQKGHYGVALMSKVKACRIVKGFPADTDDAQKRIIIGEYQSPKGNTFTVINGYFPQGENRKHPIKFPAKKRFYEDLMTYLNSTYKRNQPLLIMGDFNISSTDLDIGIGEVNAKRWLSSGKCSFLPEERGWFDGLLSWGFFDCYRLKTADQDTLYSWFDYRSRGFEKIPKRGLRIDGILATQILFERCEQTDVEYEVRGLEKPSDHAPVWVLFDY